jgi:predicted GIY-YIG superfamily endonuclease
MQYLYRAYGSKGELLYIGISSQWHHRLHQHEKTSEWIEQATNVTIERFPDRESVSLAERKAVEAEKPIYNKVFAHDYESAPIHWAKIKTWIKTGRAPDDNHQLIVDAIRETALDVYENKPAQLRPKGMAFLFLDLIEMAVYNGYKPCRNCVGLWNSSIIQPGYEGGEEQLLGKGEGYEY